MDIYVSYTCLKITSVFHITLMLKNKKIMKVINAAWLHEYFCAFSLVTKYLIAFIKSA